MSLFDKNYFDDNYLKNIAEISDDMIEFDDDLVYAKFLRYIKKALIHNKFNYLRHNKKFSSEYDLEEKAWECIIDENANVEKIVLDEINIIELNKKLNNAREGLSPKQQKVLDFYYNNRMSRIAIAMKLAVSERAIGYIKSRALKKLKKSLFVGVYYDNGYSGTNTDNRIGFKNMLKDCAKGKIDFIVTKSVSRFARNTIDTLNYVRKLKESNIGIYFEEENINTLDMNGELLLTILSSISQQESLNLSNHVNYGTRMKMQRGEPCGTVKCYGYNYDNETGIMTINEEEAKVIRMIVKWYLEGDGTSKIANRLNDMGIPSSKNMTKVWRNESITRILKNEKIKGDLLIGKYYTPDPLSHKRKRNNGAKDMYYVHNHHEPIISKEEWKKIMEEMERRSNKYNNNKEQTYLNRYGMSGKLKCGYCNGPLHRLTTSSIKEAKYFCAKNKSSVYGSCTPSKMINESILEKAFMQSMTRLKNKLKTEKRFSDKFNDGIIYIRKMIERCRNL